MSVDYITSLAVGYRITQDELRSVFGKEVPQVTHTEKRFDPKTGQRLPDEIVVDIETTTIMMFEGKKVEDAEHCLEVLVEKICIKIQSLCYHIDGDMTNGEYDFIIGPSLAQPSSGEEISLNEFLLKVKDVEQIGRELRALGLNVGEPSIVASRLIC